MQYFSALAGHKRKLFAAIAITLGVLLLALTWSKTTASEPAAPAPVAPEEIAALVEGEDEAPIETTSEPATDSRVIVYISGAVVAPDVYQLPQAARIKDLVLAAGGFSADADPEQLNLAERLSDGQHIQVPRQGEARQEASDARSDTAGAAASEAIDINTASAADLDELPGIGQALAERIIEYRAANGPFKAADELRNVKGIGPALFEKIAPLIAAGP